MSTDNLIINEIFYSIQGEGLYSGKPTTFIRLTGCPLRCTYCDTEYAFHEGSKMDFKKIFNEINSFNCREIMVTGGEPLSQTNVISFLKTLCDNSFSVSIETSNALDISLIDKRVIIVLDVKTPGSGESKKNLIKNFDFLKPNDKIKFVICNQTD